MALAHHKVSRIVENAECKRVATVLSWSTCNADLADELRGDPIFRLHISQPQDQTRDQCWETLILPFIMSTLVEVTLIVTVVLLDATQARDRGLHRTHKPASVGLEVS